MERSLSSLKFEINSNLSSETHETSKCGTCGEEFETPLFTVVSSGYLLEEYYACPRCLSKVGTVERSKPVEAEEAADEEEVEEEAEKIQEFKVEDKTEEAVACAHHLGYLKRRPKSTSIPEECFTCAKMIDCMSH